MEYLRREAVIRKIKKRELDAESIKCARCIHTLCKEIEQMQPVILDEQARVYISGPITGTEDYMERFEVAERYIKSLGFEVVNPAKVNDQMPELTHDEYMQMCMTMLELCDAIYMMNGWEDSKGAKEEFEKASMLEMEIMFEVTRRIND